MAYDRVVVRQLLMAAFSDEDLTVFCADYFQDVYEQFGSESSKRAKALKLVDYCHRRGEIPTLLDKIKDENPHQYQEYKPRLEISESRQSVMDVENLQDQADELESIFDLNDAGELTQEGAPSVPESAQATNHPLLGGPQEIKRWFLEQLSHDEQVFVATAALFSGLERQDLMAIYHDITGILEPNKTQTGKER